MITLFFSKQDTHSIENLEDFFLPKDGFIWFLESKESQKWLTIYDNNTDEDKLTINPREARKFVTEASAITYRSQYKLGDKFIPTEHEFVDNQKQ